MFINVDQDCVLVDGHDCCFKSIGTLMLPLMINSLFILRLSAFLKILTKIKKIFWTNSQKKIDIICISETRLTDAKLKTATISIYQMYCITTIASWWQEVEPVMSQICSYLNN